MTLYPPAALRLRGHGAFHAVTQVTQTNDPQRFTVRHLSAYRYSEPVEFGEHRMMFRPRSSHDLRLVTTQLHITPTPAHLHWLHDVFDNSVAVATFADPGIGARSSKAK